MRDFNRGDRRGGGRSFGGRDSRPKTMFQAVCDKCGQDCEVPFRPTGEKPVLCNNCFRGSRDYDSRGGRDDSRGFKPRSFEPRSNDNSKQFAEINAKLDKIIASLKA